jgi:hypothetical protein
MRELISFLGLIGFVGGVLAVIALSVQRDTHRQNDDIAERKHGGPKGAI